MSIYKHTDVRFEEASKRERERERNVYMYFDHVKNKRIRVVDNRLHIFDLNIQKVDRGLCLDD